MDDRNQMIGVNLEGVLLQGLRREVKPYSLRATSILPGAVATKPAWSVTEPGFKVGAGICCDEYAMAADSFGRAGLCAMSPAADVAVNEILFRPACPP